MTYPMGRRPSPSSPESIPTRKKTPANAPSTTRDTSAEMAGMPASVLSERSTAHDVLASTHDLAILPTR
jgi:hypothetical protein